MKIATSHVFCGPHDFMRRAQVDDASDTRPFHVDAKGRGGQTTPSVGPRWKLINECTSLAAPPLRIEKGRGSQTTNAHINCYSTAWGRCWQQQLSTKYQFIAVCIRRFPSLYAQSRSLSDSAVALNRAWLSYVLNFLLYEQVW